MTRITLLFLLSGAACSSPAHRPETARSPQDVDSTAAVALALKAIDDLTPQHAGTKTPDKVVEFIEAFDCGYVITVVPNPPPGVASTGGGGKVFVPRRSGPCVIEAGM
jgi:hypothetical protein